MPHEMMSQDFSLLVTRNPVFFSFLARRERFDDKFNGKIVCRRDGHFHFLCHLTGVGSHDRLDFSQ